MRTIETPVLIVGGGPVGLALALDLSWRGVESTMIERTDGAVRNPKTGHISIRSMEFFRRWGIVDRIRNCGFPDDYELSMVFCTSLAGHQLTKHYYPPMRDDPQLAFTPERKQRAPQMYSDPIIAAAVRERDDVTVRYRCEFLEFEQDEDKVVSRVRDLESGEELRIVSRYLAACDGAASPVRRALGIEMQGDPALNYSIAIHIRAKDLLLRHDKGQAERYILLGPEGTWGNLTVVDGKELWRLTVMGSQERIDAAEANAAYWMQRCFGREDIPYEILLASPWRRSRLVAGRYTDGRGRVFLVGDSAHTMSPTGGFGMNTGIGDAADIGWKFEAAVRGWAGPGLLASYEAERQPIGWRNVNAAADNFHSMMSATDCSKILDETPEGEVTRKRVGEQVRIATQKEWDSYGVVLGYRYEGSPIIMPDGSPAPEDHPSDYTPTSRPGHRAPHAWVEGGPEHTGKSILDLFGKGFTLLRFDSTLDPAPMLDAARTRGVPVTLLDIANPGIAKLYEKKLVLVRPDGHSAWRGDAMPADAMKVIDTVRGA